MVIQLPDSLLEQLKARAERAGINSPEEYVIRLIQEDIVSASPADLNSLLTGESNDGPEGNRRRKKELERLLLERIDSKDWIEVVPEFWANRRRKREERIRSEQE